MPQTKNPFGAESTISSKLGDLRFFRLNRLTELGIGHVDELPSSMKVLLESSLRNTDNFEVAADDTRGLSEWNAEKPNPVEGPFKVARVVLQDFTVVPVVVDVAP